MLLIQGSWSQRKELLSRYSWLLSPRAFCMELAHTARRRSKYTRSSKTMQINWRLLLPSFNYDMCMYGAVTCAGPRRRPTRWALNIRIPTLCLWDRTRVSHTRKHYMSTGITNNSNSYSHIPKWHRSQMPRSKLYCTRMRCAQVEVVHREQEVANFTPLWGESFQ